MNKTELVAALVKGGLSQADAEAAVATQTSTDADLMRENNMKTAEIENLRNKVKQATDLFNRINQEKDAAEQAEKLRLIHEITVDSAWTEDQLKGKDLKTLQEINTTLKLNNNKTFASVAADLAEQDAKKNKPHLTAGAWDSAEEKWVGGL